MTGELDIARQWILKARNDLLDADNNPEKLLKAVLAAKSVPPAAHT